MIEQVSGKTAFHVNRALGYAPHAPMQAGDRLKIGEAYNPFFANFETGAVAGAGRGGLRLLREVRDGAAPRPRDFDAVAAGLVEHSLFLARELLAELVRVREFPKAPSRMTCLWVVESEADARAWADRMRPDAERRIVELRLTGTLLRCDAAWLMKDTNSPYSRRLADAKRYWSGDPCPRNSQSEILFEGEAEVVTVCHSSPAVAGDQSVRGTD
jgi:hypothetical protein